MASANDVERRLDTHEAVCAERYKTFIERVDRLEKLLLRATGALITGLVGVLVTILMKGFMT